MRGRGMERGRRTYGAKGWMWIGGWVAGWLGDWVAWWLAGWLGG